MTQHRSAILAAALGLAASALAQNAPPAQPAKSTRVTVTPQGAWLQESLGSVAHARSAASLALTSPGLSWSHSDGGLGWIGTAVSLGERGTQVLAGYDLNSEAIELFSAFDSNPPSAVWSDPRPGTELRSVASADAVDTHVAIDQEPVAGQTTRRAVLRKYRSGSASPDWTYTFAPLIHSSAKAAISRDGKTIVAALTNDSSWQVEIAVFGPSSGTPLRYEKVPVGSGNALQGFDLSADGSTLYFSAGTQAYVFDLATQAVIFQTDIGASFDSHAISGDGSVFAFGSFFLLRVWERSGSTYVNTHIELKSGNVYCARLDLSDDGSTLAAGWYSYDTGLTVTLEALDVPTKTITMSETLTGVGTLQNLVADVACSADGTRFAVGLWGDPGSVDEVRLYARDQDVPLVTLDTPGSVFDVDLSADGQRLVAASKAVHANTVGNGGRIDLLDAGGEDCVLRGRPALGTTVSYQVHGEPGRPAFLLTSLAEAQPPISYPGGVGTLFIERSSLTLQAMGTVQPSGIAELSTAIGSDPSLVGTSLFHQGLILGPRRLTKDWLKVTLLP